MSARAQFERASSDELPCRATLFVWFLVCTAAISGLLFGESSE